MTKVRMLTLFCAALLVALSHATARAALPNEASLVKAWEDVQRNDPETVLFEKTGEGSYKFKTKRFPFDGELKLLKATVNDYPYGRGGDDDEEYDVPAGYGVGVIEYDLVGLSDDVMKKYEHSYSSWRLNNTLYFDKKGGEWLSLEKYRAKASADLKKSADEFARKNQFKTTAGAWLNVAAWWLPVLALTCFYFWVIKKTGLRRQREYMNMGLAHMQRSEELLERIAEAVEKNSRDAYARADASEYRSQPPA